MIFFSFLDKIKAMKPVVRNIVNHEDIKYRLRTLKTYSPDPLYHEFVEQNVKNFFIKHAIIEEAPEDFIAPFSGPYHKVVFEHREMEALEELCKKVAIGVHTKQFQTSEAITKVQVAKVITPTLEFLGTTPSFHVYQIHGKKTLNAIGEELHNCLKNRNPKKSESFFVLKNKRNFKDEVVLYVEAGFIIEARKDFDTLPSPEDWEEIQGLFTGFTKGRLKPSSSIISYSLVFVSLISLLSIKIEGIHYASFLFLAGTTFYCFLANIDSKVLHQILYRPILKRWFYEN